MKQKTMLLDAMAGVTSLHDVARAYELVQDIIGDEVTALVNSYHSTDWPIVAACLRLTAEAVFSVLPKEGQELYTSTLDRTNTVCFAREERINE